MLKIQRLNFNFGTTESSIFTRVNLEFAQGEFSLICGPTGSGKTSLLKIINRLIPTFSGGQTSGEILVGETNISKLKPHQVASLIGYVNQQPDGFFVSDTVLEELAFGMEQLGFPASEMQARIANVSKLLEIESFINENLDSLSAGQQQRVAIAAALVTGAKILLLDEPTSSLDDSSAQKLIETLRTLSTNNGITVLIAEHRFERLIGKVDSLVVLKGDGWALKTEPTIKALQAMLPSWFHNNQLDIPSQGREVVFGAKGVRVDYPGNSQPAVARADLELKSKEIVAIQGPNGSGKTSLLMALAGFLPISAGKIICEAPITVVPQNASDLLFLPSVAEELQDSDFAAAAKPNSTARLFESLVGRINPAIHPRDLSVGQQLALVISIQIASGSKLLFLDEPTRGLDPDAKSALAAVLSSIKESGTSVLVATHDIDFAKQISNRTLKMSNGTLTHESEAG